MLNFAWSSSQLSAVFIRDFPGNYFAAHVEIVQSGRGMLCSQRLEEIAKGRAEGRPTPMALNGVSARNHAQVHLFVPIRHKCVTGVSNPMAIRGPAVCFGNFSYGLIIAAAVVLLH